MVNVRRPRLSRQLLRLYLPPDFRISASARVHRSDGRRRHVRWGRARNAHPGAHGLDLHSGFNILKQRILDVVGRPSDLVLSHPPYHNIVVYSGNEQGRGAHPDDLSRCASKDEFLDKLTIALKNQRHATRAGGYYGAIIWDVRRNGVYSSYQADLIVRMPRKELLTVLIKEQHNVASNGTDYPSRLPRIMHEYVIIWVRREVARALSRKGPAVPLAVAYRCVRNW